MGPTLFGKRDIIRLRSSALAQGIRFRTMSAWKRLAVLVVVLIAATVCVAQQSKSHPVYVVLWFDTEDYILPPSDDAAKRLAEFLTAEGVPATFKVVGEKARTLQRRGRSDVIAALRRHDIGYHANTHSQHPTPAEYESGLDWHTGVAEFTRRERGGFEDVARIFGKTPCCYGQPGSSWAPQSYAALRRWGVNVYLDEGTQIGLDGKPFWYGGLLNIFNTPEGEQLRPNDKWDNLEQTKARFREFYTSMTREPGGGLISLYFHPCEFIHQWFWDVNFANGANPPPNQWKRPPLKSAAEQKQTFAYFEGLVRYMKSFPQVRFITGSEAARLFADSAHARQFSPADLRTIAEAVTPQIAFQTHADYALSASEIFELLNTYVVGAIGGHLTRSSWVISDTPYGPAVDPPELQHPTTVSWDQFARTVRDVSDFLARNHQIPAEIWFGSVAVPPEAYLVAVADVAKALLAGKPLPQTITLPVAQLAAAKYVAQDSPAVWNWPIFPQGFHSAHLLSVARLQAWTLKPALLR